MQNFLKQGLNKDESNHSLGTSLYSWMYKPEKSSKWIFALLSIVAVAVFFAYSYLDQILPFLKKIPALAVYGIIMALGWILQNFQKQGKDQEWTLYENGYKVTYLSKTGQGETRMGYWGDYKTCSYSDDSVKLISDQPLKSNVKMPVKTNVMEVYSICREHISIAHSKKLYDSAPVIQRPDTREQRHLMRKAQEKRNE
ncbi:hypothetical protein GF407_09455 [candidate division KSB1 bacterium]|nr:hypothetical protein [candidate division KSB1 bacterium]